MGPPTMADKRFLILYGSQTGQAQSIAEEICQQAKTKGYSPEIYCLSMSEKKFQLHLEPIVVIVVSTTGDGDPPDSITRFWRKLKRSTQCLDNLRFGLLGLGDTNYTNFCNMGKMLNKRLLELGARPFCETGYADDGVGLELVVEPFIEALWPSLEKVFNPSSIDESDGPICEETDAVLSNFVTEKLQLKTVSSDFDSDSKYYTEFEKALRGSDDYTWRNLSVTVPPLQQPYLNVELQECNHMETDFSYLESIHGATMSQITVTTANISNRRILTSPDAEKLTVELELKWKSSELSYEPGDALCVICPNDISEVDFIIKRLNFHSICSKCISMSLIPDSGKRNPIVPKHIPVHCTVQQYLTHCVDIRAIPKKALLMMLSEYCELDMERARLQWLSSRQGSQDYNKVILETHTDFIDLLHCFPSCNPPLSRLIELLPRLQARHYSVVSSPLVHKQSTKIAFNVIKLPKRPWQPHQDRNGLCSSWLNDLSQRSSGLIHLYPRLKNPFHLPLDPLNYIIMIGPGTGIAPFIGFLQHREALSSTGVVLGSSWLFFGCRHYNKDYLYKDELQGFLSSKVLTNLDVSFSRLPEENYTCGNHLRYVQDNIRKHWKLLSEWIMERNATIYVCGDAHNMMVNIKDAIIDVLQMYIDSKGISKNSKQIFKEELVDSGRYMLDLWN